MMKKQSLYGVLPLLVLALFASVLLSVILSGAKTYETLSKRNDAAFTCRTAAQYITTKVKQTAWQNKITTEPFGDTTALVLPAKYGDQMYLTRLYCYEDTLYELFSPAELSMSPEDGEKILSLSSLNAKIKDGMLTVELHSANGKTTTLYLFLKGGEEDPL